MPKNKAIGGDTKGDRQHISVKRKITFLVVLFCSELLFLMFFIALKIISVQYSATLARQGNDY
ncbi:MAG: hypothetical protein PW786_06825 [Arachidicoccus sp.]|nr:hypothetical protein [Arachidicoccus sp.]